MIDDVTAATFSEIDATARLHSELELVDLPQLVPFQNIIDVSCDIDFGSEAVEVVTPSATGQGIHKRWVYPDPLAPSMGLNLDTTTTTSTTIGANVSDWDFLESCRSLWEPVFDHIPGFCSYPPLECLKKTIDLDCDHSCYRFPTFSTTMMMTIPDLDLECWDGMVAPKSSSSWGLVPSAPKRPSRESRALIERGDAGGGEDGEVKMVTEEYSLGKYLDEMGDDDECLESSPRLLWKRGSIVDLKKVGNDQDGPFL